MRFSRFLIGCLLPLAGIALPWLATAATSDSSYSSPDLQGSTSPSWDRSDPVTAATATDPFELSEAFAESASDSVVSPPDSSLRASLPDSALAPPPPRESAPKLGMGARAKRAVGNFLSDGWIIVTSPLRARGADLVWAGVAIGAEVALFANDQEIFDATVRNRRDPVFGALIDVGNTIEPVGFMGRTNSIYFVALGAGYALNIRVLRTIPAEILESHFIAGGVRNLGKVIVGRRHPYEHVGPYEFNLGQGTSFPSGHTSVAFELATIASMNAHSLPVTIVAYSLAASVAVQRIESGNHWPSDVLIAAVYGTLVSRTVVKLHEAREKERGRATSLLPHFSDDGRLVGVRLMRRF